MKDGLRFVDSDMHIMEPPDLFDRYLDPKFKDRVSVPVGADGRPNRGPSGLDHHRRAAHLRHGSAAVPKARAAPPRRRARSSSRDRGSSTRAGSTSPSSATTTRKPRSWAWRWKGVDIAVNYPTAGLALIARDNIDPRLSLAICQAYNNWIHEFCQYSPDRLKFVAMLPVHDVHLACRELIRCVRELGAVGSFIRPNLVNDHYWHSNYWDPLYTVHEELERDVGIPRGRERALLAHDPALRREPLLPPRGEPLDRDAAGDDRHDHRRRVRVPSEAPRRLPRGPELLGARPPVAHRVGLPAVPRLARAVPLADAARVLPAQLLGGGGRQRARDRGDGRAHRRRPHVRLHATIRTSTPTSPTWRRTC